MVSLKHTPPLPCMVFFIQLDSSDTLGRSVQENTSLLPAVNESKPVFPSVKRQPHFSISLRLVGVELTKNDGYVLTTR